MEVEDFGAPRSLDVAELVSVTSVWYSRFTRPQ
jgi:hypothetical protein